MMIYTNTIVSATEANQNFSRATRIANTNGQMESTPYFYMTDDEKIDVIARRILNKYRPAFEELAK